MNKQSLIKDMQSRAADSGFMNQSEIARYLGKSRDYVREMMYGTEFFPGKRERKYFIPDIAEKIIQRKTTS